MGVLNKILVTPAPRSALVIGRAIAGGIRSFLKYLLSIYSVLSWESIYIGSYFLF